MRFSAIAVSAAIFGVAMAVPASVVYETEVVTITSCAPDKTNCPGRATATPTPTEVAPVVSSVPVVPVPASSTYTSAPVPVVTPIASSSVITYPNGTASASTPAVGKPSTTATGTVKASVAIPLSTGYPWTPSASASVPSSAANTSTPVVPTSPSQSFEGAASIKGFSFAAVAVAAAAFVLA